jgi:ABC-type xylose transport system permease subunit
MGVMTWLKKQLGTLPSLLLGLGLIFVGLSTLDYIVNNWWPFDVARLDLVRAATDGSLSAPLLLDAANYQILGVFLGAVLLTATGFALPLAYILNKRLNVYANKQLGQSREPKFMVTIRQALEVGVWAAFCTWLQMNRAFGLAVALLVAAVLVLFEFLLQVRARTAV